MVVTLDDCRSSTATLVGTDTLTDLAIIKIDAHRPADRAHRRLGRPRSRASSPLPSAIRWATTQTRSRPAIVSGLGRQIKAPMRADEHRAAEQPDPDRCRHQPRQLGRPAGQQRGPGHRHQHRGRRPMPRASASRSRSTSPSRSWPSPSTARSSRGRGSASTTRWSTRPLADELDLPVDDGALIGDGPRARRRSSPAARARRPVSRRATSSPRSPVSQLERGPRPDRPAPAVSPG